MKKILLMLSVICLLSCDSGKNNKNDSKSTKLNDSIFYSKTKDGLPLKTIFYQSKQIDSFKLRVRYRNGMFSDSMYISDNDFIFGKSFKNIENDVKVVSEYLNIDGENFLNQYWTIKGKDTLGFGNNYNIRVNNFQDEKQELQVEIILRMSKYKIFSKLFFIYPKGGDFSKLNSDFSNYREIEYDTIYNLISYNDPNDDGYDEYWSKRSVIFNTDYDKISNNYLRGILIERKDTSFTDYNSNKIKYIDRYLYINRKLGNSTD